MIARSSPLNLALSSRSFDARLRLTAGMGKADQGRCAKSGGWRASADSVPYFDTSEKYWPNNRLVKDKQFLYFLRQGGCPALTEESRTVVSISCPSSSL